MNMVIVLEIVLGILLLAVVVRFAVRDARQRSADSMQEQSDPEPVLEGHGGERQAQQPPSEIADPV